MVLPEKWSVLGPGEAVRNGAEALDGRALTWARAAARELRIDLVAGSIAELPDPASGDERGRNTCVHVGPDGTDRACYRKIHMFDATVDGTLYAESAHEAPGDEVVVSELADGSIAGLAVCYDLRFPELFRVQARHGARILVLPSAFTAATTSAHWDVLVRARAIENACFVVAANQVGEHAPGLRSGGRSVIVDPWGEVLDRAPEGEGFALAQLDTDLQDRVRTRLPVLDHVRPEVYV